IRVETAGQGTGTGGAAVIGVKDCRAFRDRVLEERDRVVGEASSDSPAAAAPSAAPADGTVTTTLLAEIGDTLKRIEAQLAGSPRDSSRPADPRLDQPGSGPP